MPSGWMAVGDGIVNIPGNRRMDVREYTGVLLH